MSSQYVLQLYSLDWIPQFITGDFDSIKEEVLAYYKEKVQNSPQGMVQRQISLRFLPQFSPFDGCERVNQ
jgi:hypothetical protein